jgi:hypothetical protein
VVVILSRFPSGHLAAQGLDIGKPSVYALAGADRQLTCGPSQPTAMHGRQMKLELAPQPAGVGRREDFLERGWWVEAQVLHDHVHLRRRGEMDLDQRGQAVGQRLRGASGSDRQMPPPWKRLGHHAQLTGAMSGVFIVKAHRVALSQGLGRTAIRPQRAGALIKADAWARGSIRCFVQIAQGFHPRDALGVRLGAAPLFLAPRRARGCL